MATKKATSKGNERPLHLSNRDKRGDAAKSAKLRTDASTAYAPRAKAKAKAKAEQASKAKVNTALGKVKSSKGKEALNA